MRSVAWFQLFGQGAYAQCILTKRTQKVGVKIIVIDCLMVLKNTAKHIKQFPRLVKPIIN
jgi:hypothetical protein